MSNYIVNWSDDQAKAPLTIVPAERNTDATSLILFGKGSPNYGEGIQENFIRLLENFAKDTAPSNPTTGQLWFDTNDNSLKVYDGVAFVGQGVSNSQPASPDAGDLYFDGGNGSLELWDGVDWNSVITQDDLDTALANIDITDLKPGTAGPNEVLTVTSDGLGIEGTTLNLNHNHDGVYQPVGSYQPAGDYASGTHNHPEYVEPAEYATSTTGGTVKARLVGTVLYMTIDGNDA